MARYAAYALVVLAPLTVFAPLGPPLAGGIVPFYVQAVAELSDAAALLLILASLFARRERPASPATLRAPFTGALLMLAALGLVTSPFALSPPLAAYSALRWLLSAGVAWALVRAEVSAAAVATAFSIGLVAQAAIGTMQVLAQSPLGLPGELMLPASHPGAVVVTVGATRFLRACGLTFHPNVLGGFLCVGILFALPRLDRLALRVVWWILWLGLLLTFSRSAWLAIALTLPVAATWLFVHRPAWRGSFVASLAGAALGAVVAAAVLAPQLATRLTPVVAALGGSATPEPVEQGSIDERVEMARSAMTAIAANPLTGVGAGNFPLEMRRQHSRVGAQYVHDVPLLLAAEVGFLGGIVWSAAWLAGVVVLTAGWRRLSPTAVSALAAWCAIGVIGLFDCYPWSLPAGRLLTALTLGLVDRARLEGRDD
jgi:O-antigen ligase